MRQVILDTYGADIGEEDIIRGAIDSLRSRDDYELVIVGDENKIRSVFEEENFDGSRVNIIPATDFITNHDNPVDVFRGRNESSMVLALEYLKKNEDAVGLVSAGNTGALMIGAISRVGIKPGMKSPVLASLIPNPFTRWQLLVDCGSHLEPTPEEMLCFAELGSNFYRATYGIENPTVGLLSVGSEESKGTEKIKQVHALFKESDSINFFGNVEGSDMQNGKADVIVADGYAGNVLLKSVEASCLTVAKMTQKFARDKGLTGETKALFDELVSDMYQSFDFTTIGGAFFLGTKKLIVKMHGASNRITVKNSIDQILKTDFKAFS